MPRYATNKPYQVGDYWLSKQTRSPAWCRTWYCKRTQQTRRTSLRTIDFDEAKQRLNEWFVLECQQKNQPTDQATIAAIFSRYYKKYGSTLKSYDSVKRNLRHWLEFHGEATLAEVADLHQQEEFRNWLQTKKKLSLSSVRKVLVIGKAAFNWAYKRGEIDQVPYFEMVKVPKPEPMGRHLEVSEIADLFRATTGHHQKMFLLMLLGTAARPQAVLDLRYDQIDFERDIIDLNPIGREQTSKTRPTVKLPQSLKPLLLAEQSKGISPYIVQYQGEAIKSTKTSWQTLRERAKLDNKVLPYSMRRTMARWLRLQGVPAWEVAEQLGHSATGYRITELYTSHSPDYLEKSVAAIDLFFGELTCELRVTELIEVFGRLK